MSSSQETTDYALYSLRATWEDVRQGWDDSTSEHFAAYYWQPLESEAENFQRLIDHLTDVLEAANNVAGY